METFFYDFCWWCIYLMQDMASLTGISYEALNILLFVVANPLGMVLFMISAILALLHKKKPAFAFLILGFIEIILVLSFSGASLLVRTQYG